MASRLGTGGLVGIALGGVAALAGIVPVATPLAADVGLGVIGAGALAMAGWGWSVLRHVRQLPLELGPEVARSRVDGAVQLRVRARLGRGRFVRRPRASVSWIDEHGAETVLSAEVPAERVVGPFTVVVADPEGVAAGDGSLRVRVEGESAGRSWEASRTYQAREIRDGTFGGVVLATRGVALPEADWAVIHRS